MRPELVKAYELFRSGRQDAALEAVRLLQNTVFSFSMTVCGHREDAEDTMQEVLLKAIPYLSRFESPQALSSWLYTVARNQCWMSRRRGKFEPRESLSLDELMPGDDELRRLQEPAAGAPSPERSVISREGLSRLRQAILALPPAYRMVLVLHDVEELSTGEVSRILNLKDGSVRVRLHRARLALRKQLAAGGKLSRSRPVRQAAPARPAKCRRIFANLSEYLDGELDHELCEDLLRHMSGCKACQSFLDDLRRTVESAHTMPLQNAPARAAARSQKSALPKLMAAAQVRR